MAWYDRFTNKPKKYKKGLKRSYAGAQTGRLFADFVTSGASADTEIYSALVTLRNRSRELARNDGYVSRYLKMLVTNVVGEHGIRVSMKARNDDGSLDNIGNNIIEEEFRKWSRLGSCTSDGKLSFLDAQKLFVETLARDGEVLVRHINDKDNDYGYSMQFLEADHLDEQLNKKNTNKTSIRMGVEVNEFNKPINYHLWTKHPNENQIYFQDPKKKYIVVPAKEMIHAYIQNRPEQTRGVPFTAPVMTSIKMLNGYLEAELVAARVGASKMGFFVGSGDEDYVGEDFENTYNPVMNAEAGSFEQLPNGTSVETFDPNHPATAFGDFQKSVLREIASGLNVSYVELANNLEGVNYSSIRQGTIADRDNYRIMQKFLVEHFIEPVFRKWLNMAMTTKKVNLPFSKFDKFAQAVRFIPRSYEWVDPLKEANASINLLQNGLVTLQDIQKKYGRDVEELYEELDKENELSKNYNVEYATQPYGTKFPVDPVITGNEEQEDG
jgi:lambda family phage portal protein